MTLILPTKKSSTEKSGGLILPGQDVPIRPQQTEYFGIYQGSGGLMSGKIPFTPMERVMVERQFTEAKSEWIKPIKEQSFVTKLLGMPSGEAYYPDETHLEELGLQVEQRESELKIKRTELQQYRESLTEKVTTDGMNLNNIVDLSWADTKSAQSQEMLKSIEQETAMKGEIRTLEQEIERIKEQKWQETPKDIMGGFKVLGQSLIKSPKAIVGAAIRSFQSWRGASWVNKDVADKYAESVQEDLQKFAQQATIEYQNKRFLPGISISDVAQLPENIAFSATTMGMGLAAGFGVKFLPGGQVPGTGVATFGMVSGKIAFNLSSYNIMMEYLELKNDEMQKEQGRDITLEEENQLKEEFGANARKHGLWEAIPEGLGNMVLGSLFFGKLAKVVGSAGGASKIASKLVGLYGEELTTETITEMGQTKVRSVSGLPGGRDVNWLSATDWLDSLKSIAPQTFLLTTLMAGAGRVGISTKQAAIKLKEEIGGDHPAYNKFMDKIKRTWDGSLEGFPGLTIEDVSKGKPTTPEKGIPKELQPLAKEAKKYKSAAEFSKAWSIDGMRGRYWHITDDINFQPKKGVAPSGEIGQPQKIVGAKDPTAGLIVSSDPANWLPFARDRKYMAEIDLSKALPDKDYTIVNRGFGQEVFVKNIDKISVKSVKPINQAMAEVKEWKKLGFENKQEAIDFYTQATKEVKPVVKAPSVKKVLGVKPAPFVETKKRETTLLKERIKDIQKQAKIENWGKVKLAQAIEKARISQKKAVRKEQLKTIKVGITERFKGIQKGLKEGKITTKQEIKATQTELLDILDKSKLELADKAKFRKTIKNIQTQEQLAKVLPEFQERVATLEEKATKKTTKKKIINEFKKLKAKKAEKGKTSVEFEMLRNALRTKYFEGGKISGKLKTQVENDILFKELQASIENYDISNPIDYEDFVLYAVLSESTKGLDEMSTAELEDALTRLQQTKKLARDSFIFKQLDRASEIKKLIDESVENMQGKGMREQTVSNKITIAKKLKQFVSTADIHDRGFLQIINLLDSIRGGRFYKDALYQPISEANKEYFKVDEAAFAKDEKMLKEAFGTSGTKFDLKINKLGKQVNIGKVTDAQNNEIDLWFSDLEMIDIYLSSKTKANLEAMKENGIYIGGQDRSKRVFYMVDDVIEKIISKMSPEAKKMAEYISENILDKDFNKNMAQAYETKYNKPFPYVKDGYWTIRRYRMGGTKKQKEADVFNPIYSQQTVLSPSSFKERVENQNPLKIADGWAKYIKWRKDILKFVAYDTALTNAKSIIMSSEIASEFTERYGASSYRHLLNSFDITANGAKNYDDKFASGSNYIRRVLSVAFIGGKLRNILSQGTSFVAAISDIPVRGLNKSLGKFAANPKKAYDKMMESPIIRLRHKRANFSKGLLESEMKAIKKQGFSSTNTAMFFTKAGDMLGVLGAGYAIYDYNYNQYIADNMGHELADKRAMQDAENFVVSTQQSALNELKNQIMQAHPFIRTAGAFQQAQSMYRARGFEFMNTWVNSNNKWSKANFNKMAKGVFTYHFVLPALYELSRGNINPLSITAKTIFSPISGFMGYGKVVEYGIMFSIVKLLIPLFGGDDDDWKDILPFDPNTLIGESKVIFDRTVRSMNDLIEGEADEKDVNNLIDSGLMFLSVPSKNIREEHKKFQDIFSGNDATFLRFLQTEWQSEQRLKSKEEGRPKWGVDKDKEEEKGRVKWEIDKDKKDSKEHKKWDLD